MKDLQSLCSRLNLPMTGGRAALIKRINKARQNTDNLSGTPPPIYDGSKHIANQNAMEMQFQQLQLRDQESPQDGLLSATQLTQVQSIVQGSLNEVIERAALAAAQAAVRAFSGSPSQAPDQATPTGESSVDVTTTSVASTSNSPLDSQTSGPSLGNYSKLLQHIQTQQWIPCTSCRRNWSGRSSLVSSRKYLNCSPRILTF